MKLQISVRRIILQAAALAAFTGIAAQSYAAEKDWIGGTGNWNEAANWSPSGVPTAADDVLIDGDPAVNSVVNMYATGYANYQYTQDLTIDLGDTLNMENGRQLLIHGASVVNNGALNLLSTGGFPNITLMSDNTTFSGSGVVHMSNDTGNGIVGRSLYSFPNNPSVLTNAAGHTIQGSGWLGRNEKVNAIGLDNQGLILADQSNPLTIDLHPAFASTNTGTMRAENGGQITFYLSTLSNSNLIEALAGSTVRLYGSSIQGGTLHTDGTSRIDLENLHTVNAGLKDLTLDGNARVLSGNTAYLEGAVDNQGDIRLDSSGVGTTLLIQGDVTLSGNGTLTMSDSIANVVAGSPSSSVLTNSASHTIQGAGNLGASASQIGLNNQGLILANQPSGLSINLTDTDGVTRINDGTMRADGGQLTIRDTDLDNTGGVIEALNGSNVALISATITGGSLSTGAGSVIELRGNTWLVDLTNTGHLIKSSQTGGLQGTISNTGDIEILTGVGTQYMLITGDVTLDGTGRLSLGNNSGNTVGGSAASDVLTNSAAHTIEGGGRIGSNHMGLDNRGLILANQTTDLTVNLTNTAGVTRSNSGTMRADGGELRIEDTVLNNTGGDIEGRNGSHVVVNGSTIIGGTLATDPGSEIRVGNFAVLTDLANQGQVVIESTSSLQGIIVNSGDVTVDPGTNLILKGNVTLDGGGTLTLTGSGNAVVRGENAANVLTNSAAHTIQGAGLLGGNSSMGLDNRGLIVANQTAALSINTSAAGGFTNSGTLRAEAGSTLSIHHTDHFTNSGTVHANGGTVNANGGFSAASGTVLIEGNGIVSIGADSSTSFLTHNGSNPAGLTLGANDLTVLSDYTNANFGVGDSFDHRTNVFGTGQILAGGDVAQAVNGASVSDGGTATPTLTLNTGNVHVGVANTFTYQIANTGTAGPVLRGALQTGVSGGNITDARLSGSGVTASNWGPMATGGNTGDLNVVFTADVAGALAPMSGQKVNIANNFDNVGDQLLAIELASGAAAYNLAQGNAVPTPVVLDNQRVGATGTQVLTVTNTAPAGNFTEGLNAGFGANTGDATNNVGSISLLAGGASNSTHMAVGVDTGSAGAKSGTVTLNYVSDGTGTSGLGQTAVGNQVINVSGNVYQVAQPTLGSTVINVGNRHVRDIPTEIVALSLTNTSAAPLGFQEALNAGFSGTTGNATATGNVSLLGQGATDNVSLRVGIDTSTAGAKTGTATLALESDGSGTSGLGTLGLAPQTVTVTGGVYRLADARIDNPGDFSFGNVHVGDTVQQFLSITNDVVDDGWSERLDASFGGTTDGRILTSGSISLLGAGATDSSSMLIAVNTAAAGVVNGTATVNFASNGSGTSGLGTIALPSQDVTVTANIQGGVYRLANPVIQTAQPVDFGNVRIDTLVASQALSIKNDVPDDGFSEKLNAAAGGTTGGVTASGSFNLLAPQGVNNADIRVGLDTSVAGNRSGLATIDFVSDGEGTSGLGKTPLSSQNVQVNGNVYRLAKPVLNTTNVVLAARVGDALPIEKNLSVTNSSPDIYTEGLKAGMGAAPAGFTAGGAIANLAAGGTDASSLGVGLESTATSQNIIGTVQVNFESTGAGTTGAPDVSVGSAPVNLTGKVYQQAVASVQPSVDFGIVHVGDVVAPRNVQVGNTAPVVALNDTLVGSIGGAGGPFTASGNLGAGVAAGKADNTSLNVALNTAISGLFGDSATVSLASHNSDMADLALSDATVHLNAQVNEYANPAFKKSAGDGSLQGTLLDFGTLVTGSSATVQAKVAFGNNALGLADLMDGDFLTSVIGSFVVTPLLVAFDDAGAGDFFNVASIAFNSTDLSAGLYTGTLTWGAVGHNGSGYSKDFGGITLNYQVLIAGAAVPEPEVLGLLCSGLVIMLPFVSGRRRRAGQG